MNERRFQNRREGTVLERQKDQRSHYARVPRKQGQKAISRREKLRDVPREKTRIHCRLTRQRGLSVLKERIEERKLLMKFFPLGKGRVRDDVWTEKAEEGKS